MNRRIATLALTTSITIAAVALILVSKKPQPQPSDPHQTHQTGGSEAASPAYLVVPDMTASLQQGAQLFTKYCSACHGAVGDGSDNGPPLVHKIYEPGHPPDEAIHSCADVRVLADRWRLGEMLPWVATTSPVIELIVPFLRAMQKANGCE